MIKEALILAGGAGTKFWPYQSFRNKAMVPISTTPLLEHTIAALLEAGLTHIVVASVQHTDKIVHAFRKQPEVDVVHLSESKGCADTFLKGLPHLLSPDEPFAVLYGDCLIQPEDLIPFIQKAALHDALVYPLRESAHNVVACALKNGHIKTFGGHHRGQEMTHAMAGVIVDQRLKAVCEKNPGRFTNLKVGVGSPEEHYLEVSLMDAMTDGMELRTVLAQQPVFDVDKPWHALEANAWLNQKRCQALTETVCETGASIDPAARVDGFVHLGKNSRIGAGVWIRGPIIVGNDTVIDHGVTVGQYTVIGDQCEVLNYAKLGEGTTLGHRCKMDQGFEVLSGLIMDHVYLVHYGEYYGMIGENTDLGAGTTCGTLRFDDGNSVHTVKGRKEIPAHFANASYLGDNARTGVCAVLMPGVKVGVNSVVGSGVILSEDVDDNTLIYVKQDTVKVPWGPNKYGW